MFFIYRGIKIKFYEKYQAAQLTAKGCEDAKVWHFALGRQSSAVQPFVDGSMIIRPPSFPSHTLSHWNKLRTIHSSSLECL
jgi:hypothetical protein